MEAAGHVSILAILAALAALSLRSLLTSLTALPSLLATLLLALTLLTALSALAILALLSILAIVSLTMLSALALLISLLALLTTLGPLAWLAALAIPSIGIAAKGFDLPAQALHAIESLLRIRLLRPAHGLLSLVQLVSKAFDPRGDGGLDRVGVWIDTLANRLSTAIEARLQVGLIHLTERVLQLGRSRTFAAGQPARGVLHRLLKPGKVVRQELAVVGELRLFIGSGSGSRPA